MTGQEEAEIQAMCPCSMCQQESEGMTIESIEIAALHKEIDRLHKRMSESEGVVVEVMTTYKDFIVIQGGCPRIDPGKYRLKRIEGEE